MVDILEQPEIRRIVSPMTVETYHRLGEFDPDGKRTELIRGIIIDKTPKSQWHIRLLRRLLHLVQMALADLEAFVSKEDPLTLVDSEPEPDLAVVGGRELDYDHVRLTTALLVIEIAVTSLALDRAKAALYAEANISEYWIVNAQAQTIEVYTEPVGSLYTQRRDYRVNEALVSTALPALSVDLAALFAD